MDIGIGPESAAAVIPEDQISLQPSQESTSLPEPPQGSEAIPVSADRQALLIAQVRKTNLTLASALEKARRWEWTDHSLLLIFESSYEAALVKNEAETLRRNAVDAGLPSFGVETRTESNRSEKTGESESSRVALVKQVFRGQVLKG